MSKREYRDMKMDIKTRTEGDESKIVEGYATTFDEPYTLYEDENWRFNEIVAKTAFNNTDMSDVIMQYDHEGRVFARLSNGTLEIAPDEHGLRVEADLSGTELGRQLYEEIKGGYTDKMSFGFTIESEDIVDSKAIDGKDLTTRTITGIKKLYDVSAVSIPANNATALSVRSLVDGEIERLATERLRREQIAEKRAALIARAKAVGEKNDKR